MRPKSEALTGRWVPAADHASTGTPAAYRPVTLGRAPVPAGAADSLRRASLGRSSLRLDSRNNSTDLGRIGAFRALHRPSIFGYIRATFRLVLGETYRTGHSAAAGPIAGALINRGKFRDDSSVADRGLCGVLAIVYAGWATQSVLAADRRQCQDAGDRRRRARGRAGLSQAPVPTIGMVGIVIFAHRLVFPRRVGCRSAF